VLGVLNRARVLRRSGRYHICLGSWKEIHKEHITNKIMFFGK
jgi:hypothetical protein